MAEKEKKFEVIPNEPKITQIEYAPRFAALCSIGEKPFHAEVEIKYQPDLLLLEFMSFEQWLLSFAV